MIFDGKNIEENPESIICLHSDCGLTIDLDAVRESMPDHEVTKFNSIGGISEFVEGLSGRAADVDVWVLVDGQVQVQARASQG